MRRDRRLRLTGPTTRLWITAIFIGIAISLLLGNLMASAFSVPIAVVVAGGWLLTVLRQRRAATDEERGGSVMWGTHQD